MTLADRIEDANRRSVALYLRRTTIEDEKSRLQHQGQGLVNQGRLVDLELVKIDGELSVLNAMLDDEKKAADGK